MADYLNNAKDTLQNNLPAAETVTNGISNAVESIRDATQNATAEFSSKTSVDAGNDFLNSNSIIAKFVFVILVLIVFMFFLNLGISLVSYFVSPSKSPYVIHGMLPGNAYTVFPQNPGNGNAVIYRSNNQNGGIEFTWSTWINIGGLPTSNNAQVIFVKGSDAYSGGKNSVSIGDITYSNIATPNNGPGLYLVKYNQAADGSGNEAALLYVMDIVSPTDGANQLDPLAAIIPNIPIGKWVHVAIRLENKMLDCYVNGVVTQRVSFNDFVPKQNYEPIIFAGSNGFNGSVSNLRYYDRALSVFEINSIVYYGPNLKSASELTSSYFDYLGQSWYNYGTDAGLVKNG